MTADLQARWEAAFMNNYGTPPLALERGAGVRVWDVDGREYFDLYAGIAVSALGHGHHAVVDAVTRQVRTLAHTTNLVLNLPALELAERLGALAGGGKVYLCNSGTEANEAAIKVVRRHHPDRTRIVAVEGGFHGRTLGALSITGQPGKRAPFAPLLPQVEFVPFDDAEALRSAITSDTAAVFLEPVQGENGVIPASAEFLRVGRKACDETGALLVLDEIQGGMGRAGAWFSHQVIAPDVSADIITMAKSLGGGLPIGACIARGAAADALQPGDHGSTFGGNPVCCAAALAVLDVLEKDELLLASQERGAQLVRALRDPLIHHVRGLGLWRAIVLRRPVAKQLEAVAREHGALINAVSDSVVRLAPPLVITPDEVDEGAARVRQACAEVG